MDTVIRGSGWTQAVSDGTNGTSTIGGQTYQHYASGCLAVLLVDTDITAQIA